MPAIPKISPTTRFHPYKPSDSVLNYEEGKYVGKTIEINNTKHPHGRGSIKIERSKLHPFGLYYTGEWVFGYRAGKGLLTTGNNTVYKGEFYDNTAHGFGTLTEPNGREYNGFWENGRRNGFGIQDINGKIYSGNWKDNKPDGLGTLTEPNGRKYKGFWENGLRNGLGIQDDNGTIYFGNWKNNKLNGFGIKVTKDGILYQGGYKNGLRHGIGTSLIFDGIKYTQTWVDGNPVGNGFRFYSNSHTLVNTNGQQG